MNVPKTLLKLLCGLTGLGSGPAEDSHTGTGATTGISTTRGRSRCNVPPSPRPPRDLPHDSDSDGGLTESTAHFDRNLTLFEHRLARMADFMAEVGIYADELAEDAPSRGKELQRMVKDCRDDLIALS